jgi:hypothetical protein
MSRYIYAFELRGIQGYLFNTGRLKDMIQASELIDYICGRPLDEALILVGTDPAEPQPRRAGGAAYLTFSSEGPALRLRDVWNLVVRQLLPGIELVDTVAQGNTVKDAVKQALSQLQTARNQPVPQLPAATPLTELAPRTGQPAVSSEGGESVDLSTFVRRQAKRADSGLMSRFGDDSLKWPNNFEADAHESRRFPLNSDNLVGMLHLDGNGIGQLLRKLNDAANNFDDQQYIAVYEGFSKGLEDTTCRAARAATEEVLVPAQTAKGVLPARPLVLGGDDLTIMVRADLAVPFAMSFASHFESLSVDFIQKLKAQLGPVDLPEKLTASGGLALVKPGFPFSQAFTLSESLSEVAKAHGVDAQGHKVSALAMHRIQGAIGDSALSLFEREKCVPASRANAGIELALKAYGLTRDSIEVLPQMQDLKSVVAACMAPEFSKARLRGLLDLLYQDPALAAADYQRWRSLMHKKENSRGLVSFQQFVAGLQELVGELERDLPCSVRINSAGRRQTALADVLMLLEAQMVSPLKFHDEE